MKINFRQCLRNPWYPAALLLVAGVTSVLRAGTLQRRLESYAAENAQLRQDWADLRDRLVAALQYMELTGGASVAGALSDGGAPETLAIPGARYCCLGGVDGMRIASDVWRVGDFTPWGSLDSAFRGGALIDGRVYKFVEASGNNEYL